MLMIALCIILAVAYLHFAQRKYTAYVQLVPVSSSQSKLPGNLLGLAGAAGIQVNGEESEFTQFLELLKSREVAVKLAQQKDLMKALFPLEWSEDENKWRAPQGFSVRVKHLIKVVLGAKPAPWTRPDGARLQTMLSTMIVIRESRDSPVTTVLVTMADSAVAVKLLASLTHEADEILRKRVVNRSGSYLDYLTKKLSEQQVQDYRQILLEIILQQESKRMLAESDLSYATDTVSGPVAMSSPTTPRPGLVLVLSCFFGLIIGSFGVCFMDISDSQPKPTANGRGEPLAS